MNDLEKLLAEGTFDLPNEIKELDDAPPKEQVIFKVRECANEEDVKKFMELIDIKSLQDSILKAYGRTIREGIVKIVEQKTKPLEKRIEELEKGCKH